QGIVLFGSVLDLHIPFFVKIDVFDTYSRAAGADQLAQFDIDVGELGVSHSLDHNLERYDLVPSCLERQGLLRALPDEVFLAVVTPKTIRKEKWIYFEGFIGKGIDSDVVPNRPNSH